jgi:hypothetical protein
MYLLLASLSPLLVRLCSRTKESDDHKPLTIERSHDFANLEYTHRASEGEAGHTRTLLEPFSEAVKAAQWESSVVVQFTCDDAQLVVA